MTADNYDSYYDFIHDFMDGLNDNHCIDIEAASVDELRRSSEEMEKILRDVAAGMEGKNTKMANIPENALNENPDKNQLCKTELHANHGSIFKNKDKIEEMGYDFHNIVLPLSEILHYRYASAEEILSKYDLFDECSHLFNIPEALNVMKRAVYEKTEEQLKTEMIILK